MSDAIVGERTRGVVMALGVLSLVATVVALVYGRKLSPREISPYDSYGRGAVGTRVLVETLPRVGIGAVRETDVERVRRTRAAVLFLAPNGPSQVLDGRVVELAELIRFRAAHGHLSILVLPKWSIDALGVAEPLDPGSLESLAEATGLSLELTRHGRRTARPKRAELTTYGLEGSAVELPYPQTAVGGTRVLASIDEGALIVAGADPNVIVVSDSDLIANYNVQRADHAALFVSLLRSLHVSEVVVDETFHGRRRSKSLAEALGEWPGVLFLVQGALVAAGALFAGRKRFGRARIAAAAYGRGPREAIAVSADVLTLGRTPTRLAVRYVELMLRDLHRRVGLDAHGRAIAIEDVAVALDRLATQRHRSAGAAALLAESRALAGAPGKKKEAMRRALDLAMRAHALRRSWLAHGAGAGGTT